MAKVVLDVPAEKIQPFIKLILKLNLDKHAIASAQNNNNQTQMQEKFFKKLSSKFLLFDGEFFNNELEIE
jgi:hypothetical protein